MAQERILVFGPTGVLKDIAISNVLNVILREEHGLSAPTKPAVRDALVQYLSLEDEIKTLNRDDLTTYFETYNPKDQKGDWKKALQQLKEKIIHFSDATVFIGIHAHYIWKGRQFSPLSFKAIKELQPTHSICLIDDLYSIWRRVVLRETTRRDGSYFRLKEIAAIRATEINISDLISQEVLNNDGEYKCKNIVISVRQTPEILYKLLFHPDLLHIYASYPISSTRFSSERQEEVNLFRSQLHDHFIVFDPLAIDEKIMQFLLIEYLYWNDVTPEKIEEKVRMSKDTITRFISANESTWQKRGRDYRCKENIIYMHKEDRWPIPDQQSMVSPSSGDHPIEFPIPLLAEEIQEVCYDIDKQIRDRDFRLIHQSQAVAMYRPQYMGAGSDGVFAEYNYAVHSERMRIFPVFHATEDGPPKEPFKAFPKTFTNSNVEKATKEMIDAIRYYQENIHKKQEVTT